MSQLEHFGATETAGSVIIGIAQQQGHQHAAKNHRADGKMTAVLIAVETVLFPIQ